MHDVLEKVKITETDVAEFLEQNPGFFKDNPELLEALHLVPEREDGVEDLRAFQIESLRNRLNDLKKQHQTLIEFGTVNMGVLKGVHEGLLKVMATETLRDTVMAITHDFRDVTNMDFVTLAIESEANLNIGLIDGYTRLTTGSVDALMEGHEIILAPVAGPESRIFGDAAQEVESTAVIALNIHGRDSKRGVLALGSKTQNAFAYDQATDLIDFTAQAFANLLARYL